MNCITVRGVEYKLPFAELFKPLTAREEGELRASIKVMTVVNPVTVYDSPTWGPNCVIDGGNRLRIAKEEEVDFTTDDKGKLDDDKAEQMAKDMNIARRQVTPEEAKESRAKRVERVAQQRREGKSLPAIAETEDISVSQVQRDLEKAEKSGLPGGKPEPPEGKVTGRDGKKQAAKKPAAERCPSCARAERTGQKAKKGCADCKALNKPKRKKDEPEPEPTESEEAWVDGWGIPITKEAAKAFNDQPKFDELLRTLRQAKKLFKELADSPGGAFLQQPFVSQNTRDGFIHKGLDTCILNVADCRPTYTVCPYAYAEGKHGKDCNLCRGLGWTGQVSKTNGPPEKLIKKAKEANGVA